MYNEKNSYLSNIENQKIQNEKDIDKLNIIKINYMPQAKFDLNLSKI